MLQTVLFIQRYYNLSIAIAESAKNVKNVYSNNALSVTSGKQLWLRTQHALTSTSQKRLNSISLSTASVKHHLGKVVQCGQIAPSVKVIAFKHWSTFILKTI